MSFLLPDDSDRARVANALLSLARQPPAFIAGYNNGWVKDPAELARLEAAHGSTESQKVLTHLALDVFDGGRRVAVTDVMHISHVQRVAIGELLSVEVLGNYGAAVGWADNTMQEAEEDAEKDAALANWEAAGEPGDNDEPWLTHHLAKVDKREKILLPLRDRATEAKAFAKRCQRMEVEREQAAEAKATADAIAAVNSAQKAREAQKRETGKTANGKRAAAGR